MEAVDATTGDLLWEYRRFTPDEPWNTTGTRARYRNVSIYDDKIYVATNDAFLVALDARTGELVWESQRADWREQVAQTTGPIIVDGMVVTGSRCNPSSPRPGGCFITGHDPQTGEEQWRVNTAATPDQVGGDTWGGLARSARRHTSAWMQGSYDPDLGLVFWGTGPPSPLPEPLRGSGKADLLYTNSTLALDPQTGELVWYFQHLPRDNWDLDHVFERFIVETEVSPDPSEVALDPSGPGAGETRKVITGIPGKTRPGVDARRGDRRVPLGAADRLPEHHDRPRRPDRRPIIDESTTPWSVTDPVLACPHLLGGKNQPSGAYSPDTGAMYMPMNNSCMDLSMSVEVAGPSDGYDVRAVVRHHPDLDVDTTPVGRLQAISASTGRTLWQYEQRAPIYGSVLATGGNLVFSGDTIRRFRAFHAETGDILWQTILNGPVSGRPMSYSVDGRQYVAIPAGGITQGASFLRITPELTTSTGSNTLFVFALPE